MTYPFPIARVGYDRQQVDEFLQKARAAYESDSPEGEIYEQKVRTVGFAKARDGYDMRAVDVVLERLEAGFVYRRRSRVSADTWMQQMSRQAATLYPRMSRAKGERFVKAARGKIGYRIEDVDKMLDWLGLYFDGDVEMTPNQVRQAAFAAAKGKKAYDMATVDAYLDRAGEVLLMWSAS